MYEIFENETSLHAKKNNFLHQEFRPLQKNFVFRIFVALYWRKDGIYLP